MTYKLTTELPDLRLANYERKDDTRPISVVLFQVEISQCLQYANIFVYL